MLPTIKQWKNWSLPSKYTAVGLLLTLVSLAFPLFEFILSQANKNQTNGQYKKEFVVNNITDKVPLPISASEALNRYKGDRNVKYDHLYLSHFHELEVMLYKVNSTRIEYPKRAIDLAVLQDELDSGDMKMAKFIANEIIEKQRNLSLIKK